MTLAEYAALRALVFERWRRDNAAKKSPHPESGVEIGRDGATVWSLDRCRRTDEGKVRSRFGQLKGETCSLVRITPLRQAPRAEQPGMDDLPLVLVASCSKIQKHRSCVL